MSDTRLIERWMPISALGIESLRERTPMTPFPAPNRLHVWWARRPLVASRAAVVASLLPADADREKFLHVLGIHGDPVAAKRPALIEATKNRAFASEQILMAIPERAFKLRADRAVIPIGSAQRCSPTAEPLTVLDPTAGGGSIPFETLRDWGFRRTLANDLNPVAALVMSAPRSSGRSRMESRADIGTRFDRTGPPSWRRRSRGIDCASVLP